MTGEVNLQKLIDLENNFSASFAAVCEKPYGRFFYNRDNPESHDSNHAIITDLSCDLDLALAEITAFYRDKDLVPRIYASFQPGEFDRLQPYLLKYGYKINHGGDRLLVWGNPSRIKPNLKLEVERVRVAGPGVIEMISPEGEWWVKVLQKILLQPDFHLLVGSVRRNPVCIASLYFMDGLTRLDDVITAAGQRGKGYGSTLIDYAVRYHASLSANALYLWAVNPAAIRIYQAAGFAYYPLQPDFWTAWLEGAQKHG